MGPLSQEKYEEITDYPEQNPPEFLRWTKRTDIRQSNEHALHNETYREEIERA
jgi:hypothetical protein